MHGINYYSVFGLIARSITLILIGFYVLPKQAREIRRPKNDFTALRWLIFWAIVFYMFTSLPSILYQITRLDESHQTLTLQNLATIAGNCANLAVGIILTLIYNYRGKE